MAAHGQPTSVLTAIIKPALMTRGREVAVLNSGKPRDRDADIAKCRGSAQHHPALHAWGHTAETCRTPHSCEL